MYQEIQFVLLDKRKDKFDQERSKSQTKEVTTKKIHKYII